MPIEFSLASLLFGKDAKLARAIRNCLAMAKDSRADFFVDFLFNDRVTFQVKGSLIEITSKTLCIYLRDDFEFLPSPGTKVHIYFSLRDKGQVIPYDFTTTMLTAKRENKDIHIILKMPERLGNSQRRFNVRIPVNKSELENFKLWYARPVVTMDDGKPRVEWVPISDEHVFISDISAGGMQIGIHRDSGLEDTLTVKPVLLANSTLVFKDKPAAPVIIAGPIVRVQDLEERSHINLGVSYRKWSKVSPNGLNWVRMTPEGGVAPLATWIFQTLLERYKETKNDIE